MRRSKLEIALNVLGAISNGTEKPTRIMYSAQLSWNSTQKTLSSLHKQGMILELSVENGETKRRKYEITEKGENVLRYFKRSEKLLEIM